MKRFFAILLATITLSSGTLYAQLLDKEQRESKMMERKVKTSGEYFYGEGSEKDLNSALSIAIDDLKLMLLESNLTGEFTQNIEKEDLERVVSTVRFESMIGKIRVIAYISREMMASIAENGINKPEAEPEAEPVAEPTPQTPPPAVTPPASKPTIMPASPDVVAQRDAAAAAAAAAAASSTTTLTSSQPTTTATPPTQRDGGDEPPTTSASRSSSASQSRKTGNPIIDQLIDITMYEEARQILNRYKSSGKLMYGQLATLSNAQNCYFLVLRNREIVDILDKASTVERVSLRTGRTVNYKESPETILWVYVL